MKSTLNLLIIILSFLMKPHQWKAFNNSTSPLYCINTLRFLFVWISLYLLFTNCQESEQEVKHDKGQTVYFTHAETRGSQDVYVILYITCQNPKRWLLGFLWWKNLSIFDWEWVLFSDLQLHWILNCQINLLMLKLNIIV